MNSKTCKIPSSFEFLLNQGLHMECAVSGCKQNAPTNLGGTNGKDQIVIWRNPYMIFGASLDQGLCLRFTHKM